ncbi:glycosyltransferase family 4 protein [Aestuariicella hydrocarbonica]|uniref:Glycosyltransferase family 4 protein n=1 Tax=Pseudomaricurvus hydrocarbonicus TaxID=1470433 RepID=A0A9E5MQC0_9GAMM|nr:glycosyltransferase [Aestuariicella hydrocarbonica]NHO68480.1 glycosyltransferase family 4 protein [Aestuariicella hydrocarbonica]
MRILQVVNGEYYAGAERVQEHLVRELAARNYNVVVVALKDGVFFERSGLKELKVVECLTMPSSFKDRIPSLHDLIVSFQPDIIHCHTPVGLFSSKLASVGVQKKWRWVYHVHSPVLKDTPSFIKNITKYMLERLSLSKSDRIICVSKAVQRKTPYLYGKHRIKSSVVHNGVPVVQKQNSLLLKKRVKLGFAGLIRPRKGLNVLVEAIAKCDKKVRDNLELNVWGEFESCAYENEIISLIDRLGLRETIQFHGFKKDIQACIASVDLFVIPSLYGEGLPMVLLEAMSVGRPVLASGIDGIPEALEDDVSGCLVTAGDVSGLASTITRLVDKPEILKTLGEQALFCQRQFFSVESMCEGVVQQYG